MKVNDFIKKLKDVEKLNTIYCTGMFGQKIDNNIITAKQVQYPKQYTDEKIKVLRSLIGKNYYGFDCVGLVKGVLWGFPNIKYLSNNVSDFSDAGVMTLCTELSTDFSKIVEGSIVWMQGHIGIYVGNGQVIECSPKWKNGVQYTNLGNNYKYRTGNYRIWTKWGKLKYIEYSTQNTVIKKDEVMIMNTLKKGSTGNDVTIFESLMKKLGYYTGTIDTHFGDGCVKACNAFQTRYPECGTNGKPDGSFGNKSWNKLISLIKL